MPVTPLAVRQISHALQENVVPLLRLDDHHVKNASKDDSKVLSRALAAVAIWDHAGCSLEDAAESVVDGAKDGGIDALFVSKSPHRIYIVQAKWRNAGNATINDEAVNKLDKGFERLTTGNHTKLNDRIQARWQDFKNAQLDPDHKTIIITALLGDDPVHDDQRDGLREIAKRHGEEYFEFRHMHLAQFRQLTRHGVTRQVPEFKVRLTDSLHRTAIHRNGKVIRPEAYSGTVLANDVYAWVDQYGDRLFDDNIRGSLGNTPVNEKIRATLQNNPEMFWTLNRGITVVAHSIKRSAAESGPYSAPAHLTLPGMSIVDGAQTASSIHRVLSDITGKGKSGDAEIPIKIISLEGAPADLAKRITFAANTQNAIMQRDFAAADEAQEELQFELDQLGKRYVYKRNDDFVMVNDDTCRIEEVAPALVCLQQDARVVAQIKHNRDTLWEQEPGGIYDRIFHPTPDAGLAWNATVFLRAMRERTEAVAAQRSGRARAFAQNADLLISHILLRLIDSELIREASDTQWRAEIDSLQGRYDETLDHLIRHCDAKYGDKVYPESTFTDVNRCKTLAALVLSDLRNGVTSTLPSPADRKRERARDAVQLIQDAQLLEEGTILEFRSPTKARRELTETWVSEHPQRARATWTRDRRRPLLWEADGQAHAPSPLALTIIEEITNRRPKSARGPDCWITPNGQTLTQLAEEAKRSVADTIS